MTIYWPVVIGLTVAWLIISMLAALAYKDANRWRGRPDYAESLAHTILWPIIAPLLLVKGGVYVVKFAGEVVGNLPKALNDIWKWK